MNVNLGATINIGKEAAAALNEIKVGSSWLHKNGAIYTVLCVANVGHTGVSYAMRPGDVTRINEHADADRRDEYPELLLIIDRDRLPFAVEPQQALDLIRKGVSELQPFVIYRSESGAVWGKSPEGFLRSRTPLEDTWSKKE